MFTAVKSIFSSNLQMPDYEPIKTYEKGYEERKYAPSRWVTTSLDLMTAQEEPAMVSKKERRDSFFKLFNYIQGENEASQKIEMTAPVAREYLPGLGPACETKYTMSFFVPKEFTVNTPKPKAGDVCIKDLPAMTVFVKKFSGFADDEKYMEEMKKFALILEQDGHQIKDNVYYFSGYDSPFKLINRRNEVWLVKDCQENQHAHLTIPAAVGGADSSGSDTPEKCPPESPKQTTNQDSNQTSPAGTDEANATKSASPGEHPLESPNQDSNQASPAGIDEANATGSASPGECSPESPNQDSNQVSPAGAGEVNATGSATAGECVPDNQEQPTEAVDQPSSPETVAGAVGGAEGGTSSSEEPALEENPHETGMD